MALSDASRPRATPHHFKAIADRKRAADQIAGGRLPTLAELYQGLGFAGGDWKHDLALWCADLMLDPQMTEYADVIRHARSTCSIHALEALRDALTHEHVTDLGRLDLYLTAAGDDDGHARAVLAILSDPFRPDPYRLTFGLALARDIGAARSPELIGRGKSAVRSASADIDALDAAEHQMREDPDQTRPSAEENLHAQIAEMAAAIEEDRAEIDPEIEPPAGLIVVPAEVVTTMSPRL